MARKKKDAALSVARMAYPDFRRSQDIEDRRKESYNRFNDSAYFPEDSLGKEIAPFHTSTYFDPEDRNVVPSAMGDALGLKDLDLKAAGFAEGGEADLSDEDKAAMQPETFVNPAVKGFIDDAAQLAATPGAVMKPNPYQEGTEDWQSFENSRYDAIANFGPKMAMNMTLGAGAIPAEANALRTGVGIASKTADKGKYAQFLKNEEKGINPQQNYQRTGWYRGEDNMARYWIDDKNAKLDTKEFFHWDHPDGRRLMTMYHPMEHMPEGVGAVKPLGEIWSHPELYEAHPWLENMHVVQHPMGGGTKGYYDGLRHEIHMGELSPEDFHNTLHHEVVHAIQHEEGFGGGSMASKYLPEDFSKKANQMQNTFSEINKFLWANGAKTMNGLDVSSTERIAFRKFDDLNDYEKQIRAVLRSGGKDVWNKFLGATKEMRDRQNDLVKAQKTYEHVAGESEARDAPFIRQNPNILKPGQIPLHVNPEIKKGDKFINEPSARTRTPPPSMRWGEAGHGPELPEDFVPEGIFEPEPGRFKKGGKTPQIDENPQDHEFIDFSRGGLIDSDIPGRTDKIPMKVKPGAYVLPADIPSALGEGNSKAGAEILKKMFTHSAYGLPPPKIHGREFHYPHPLHFLPPPKHARGGEVKPASVLPADHQLGMKVPKGGSMCGNCHFLETGGNCGNKGFQRWNGGSKIPQPVNEYCCDLYQHDGPEKKADGGAADHVPIIAAGGEWVIPSEIVKEIGNGDIKAGHSVLDSFVLNVRKEHIRTLQKLKPPK